jgi:hypothetical protein
MVEKLNVSLHHDNGLLNIDGLCEETENLVIGGGKVSEELFRTGTGWQHKKYPE